MRKINMLKKAKKLSSTYWGDIAFLCTLPVLIAFIYVVTQEEAIPDVFAISMLVLYTVFLTIALLRLIRSKKKSLRDWSYIIIAATFLLYFIFVNILNTIWIFSIMLPAVIEKTYKIAQGAYSDIVGIRVVIWCYKRWEQKRLRLTTQNHIFETDTSTDTDPNES
jgi:hypothetical protein